MFQYRQSLVVKHRQHHVEALELTWREYRVGRPRATGIDARGAGARNGWRNHLHLFATEVANRVAYQAVQLHGGYGYVREFPVERFFRDVRLWTIASGTSEIMREIIAKRILS